LPAKNIVIGQCGRCGAPNVSIRFTQYAALLAIGLTDPICGGCEEAILAKMKMEILRNQDIPQHERKKRAEAIRAKVSDVDPAPAAAPAAPQ
jgi:hypothetical protein